MRKPFIMSILLMCGMQTALAQCGFERTTDIDGGSASSTSGDHCLVLASSPQQRTIVVSSPAFPYLHQSKLLSDSVDDFVGPFVQPHWWTSHDDRTSAKDERLLFVTATRIRIPAEFNAGRRRSFNDECVRCIAMREEFGKFKVFIYEISMSAVGPYPVDLCNRRWA